MQLNDSVETLNGVGPKRLEGLHHLGIFTIEDLLCYFPLRYNDVAAKLPSETENGEKITFKGIVSSELVFIRYGYRKIRINFRLLVEHDNISVTFFNQPWIKEKIHLGEEVAVYGTYDKRRQNLVGMRILAKDSTDDLQVTYSVSKEVPQKVLKSLIEQALGEYKEILVDLIPGSIRSHYRLLSRSEMFFGMHFPKDEFQAKSARRTASFEEFFLFQMRIQLLKKTNQSYNGRATNFDNQKLKSFIKTLPFELTSAQKKVVNEVMADIRKPQRMNRLLQGDVGSGKTVVAVLAMYAIVSTGMQAALMAPTEILAQQHAKTLSKFFDYNKIRIELLTSSLKVGHRHQILEDLENGEIDILIGTSALIQKDVVFNNLGLAVIDEQHRFGVKQRAKLRTIGVNPDILAMTATPIPRTLAITAYGEMDVSVIDQLPSGRKLIKTKWLRSNEFEKVVDFIKKKLEEGAQAYVVTPLIEESEKLDVKNAQAVYEDLIKYFAPKYKVGLLHGRLSNQEKENIMIAFKKNELQVLVTTTVIEVGIDVPNSTIMLILDADRFGLAQLHQLRGRVGRGSRQSYAFLIADPKNQVGIERMEAMVKTNDGFILAQKDLELRGSGDILGNRQSGMPEFKVGNPVNDLVMMEIAQQEAIKIINTVDWEDKSENVNLSHFLSETMERYRNFD